LHAVAGRELVLGRTGLGLHAVDEEEPVAGTGRAAALEPVDRLDEAPAEAGLDLELGTQEAHDGLILAQRLQAGGAEEGGERPPHGTSTRSVNDRTMPVLSATAR
jgi:hypothetical protein